MNDTAVLAKDKSLHRVVAREHASVVAPRNVMTVNLACVSMARHSAAGMASSSAAAAHHPGRPGPPPASTAGWNAAGPQANPSFMRVTSMSIDRASPAVGLHPHTGLAPAASTPTTGLPGGVPHAAAPSLAGTKSMPWSQSRRVLETLIRSEKSRGTAGPLSQRQRLTERLNRLELHEVIMAGDGNCQFRALSNELYGTQEYHALIRGQVIKHLRAHRDEFEVFLGEDFDDYLAAMSKPGTWGDELTLRAASDSYGVVVRCITSEDDNWYISYVPAKIRTRRELFLVYLSPIHYNCVRRNNSINRLKQSLSRKLSLGRGGSATGGADPVRVAIEEGGGMGGAAAAAMAAVDGERAVAMAVS